MPVGPAQSELTALDAAVADVDAARKALLAAPAAVVSAATALDAADEACASGDRARAVDSHRAARGPVGQVGTALATYAHGLEAYRSTLRALVEASAPLEPGQQEALAALADAGAGEAQALAAFGEAARSAWPAYQALDRAQSTWLDRAAAGWYRSQEEAANGYAVLRRPGLPALEQARTQLAQADAGRRPATDRVRAALGEANRALDGLR